MVWIGVITLVRSDPARFESNELSFVIIPATLLCYANSAPTDPPLAVDTETGINVYISFHSAHGWECELSISE